MISLLRRNKATIGLDIGSSYVKAAAVDHSGTEPELTRIAYRPLGPDAIVDGEIMDPVLVADAVRGVLESLGAGVKRIVTAVGGRDIMVKKIQMDRMPVSDARQVIRWEAEQYVPFDMEGVALDFQVLDPQSDGLQMDVLLVAAKRDLVEQRMLLLREAGVVASVVDVDAFALHNALQYNYPEAARGLVVLVNIGNDIATAIVQEDGVPLVTRDLALGSRRLREELRRLHRMGPTEIDAAMTGRHERQTELLPFFRERGEELATGIERAVAFIGGDASFGRAPRAVYLCGGGARTPLLAETVAARLSSRVEIANPLERLRVHPDAASVFPPEELAPMLMLPVGLALRSAA